MIGEIEELTSTLYEMVQDAWSLPLSSDKCVLERDKVLDLLDEISKNLPTEFADAKTIVENENKIATAASNNAAAIIEEAENKAKQMVSQETITKRAIEEAKLMIADAEEKANQIIENANKKVKALKVASISYLIESLTSSEDAIRSALEQVVSAKGKLDDVLGNLIPAQQEIPEEPAQNAGE